MKEIPLTQGKVAFVDDKDYELVSQFKWCAHHDRNTFYAMRGIYEGEKHLTPYMHHLFLNAKKGFHVDHKDGNGLNNQRGNLRYSTFVQNQANRRPITGKTTKGVCRPRGSKKWIAYIRVNYRQKYLGSFSTENEAALAYNEAAKQEHGVFARLNLLALLEEPKQKE